MRRPFLWMLSVALVVLAAIAITRIVGLRHELQATITRDLQVTASDFVDTWEAQLVDQLEEWVDAAALDPGNAEQLQGQLRRREPWFDSLYVWVPPPRAPAQGQPRIMRGTLLFPTYPPSEEPRRIQLHPCLGRARALSILSEADPVTMAELYLQGCAREDLLVRLVAATEAANLLHREGHHQAALHALDSVGIPPDLPIEQGIEEGIPPFRMVGHRTQRAEILMALGQQSEALALFYETGLQITRLDAPRATGVLLYVRWPIIAELEAHGQDARAARLEVLLSRAERRVRAWREIEDRILPRTSEAVSTEGRFIYDQYSETPFLLYYSLVADGSLGVAVVLDQPMLLADFLSQQRLSEYLVVTDVDGDWVAGTRAGGPVAVEIPFTRTLTHLRAAVRQEAVFVEMRRYGNQWVTPLVVTVIFVLVGLGGLFAQIRASNRQLELMDRQREFTTRVTHELKTPLAGIRVMAENVESGAFRDEHHLRAMALRIMDEADKLTSRVDEILSVGRHRKLPDPVRFDPEEAVLEAIDVWGPRLDTAGVKLEADLHPTEEVLGDQEALRDAIGQLLDNALKYRNEKRADPHVWLTLDQVDGQVVIDVADNGLGVPPTMRRSIFDQFVRVEGPNRGRAGGHGLGLSQVAEIARLHGGSVECGEGVEGGARFTLRLPFRE